MAAQTAARWLALLSHVPEALIQHISIWPYKIVKYYFDPYLQITISEYGAESFHRSDFFKSVEAYLSEACASRARSLKVEHCKDLRNLQIAIDDNDEVTDSFQGANLWWYAGKKEYCPRKEIEPPRYYRLVFHRRHRDLVVSTYLPKHVLEKGRVSIHKNRRRRLLSNISSGGGSKTDWSHVPFEHPATFDTLAMDPLLKEAVKADLLSFMESKEYYASVGKAWKRGYLLYGPPGTGKSTMIAAMANFLDYDIYDLDLTAVATNTELRRLFIETPAKSIIVIEDIDCSSLDLDRRGCNKKKTPPIQQPAETKVTLSGLLNFIDGLWSACGGERIIIFTTNHLDKLDPALIRRGRMDMRIEMSYCTFEAFKVLAKNYLHIHDHELFGDIRRLLEEVDMTPADVAENLMSKKRKRDSNDACRLAGLVEAMEDTKKYKTCGGGIGKGGGRSQGEGDGGGEGRGDEKKSRKQRQGQNVHRTQRQLRSNGHINGGDKRRV